MLSISKLSTAFLLCSAVLAQDLAIAERNAGLQSPEVAERQIDNGAFSTVGSVCLGCPIPTPTPISTIKLSPLIPLSTTSTSSRFSVAAKTTTSSTSSSPPPTPTIATGPYDPLALTTTFTQPATCTDYSAGFSVIEEWGDEMWLNAIYSKLPTSSYSSCFPPQFYSSVLATTSGLPFKSLVCPYLWEPYNLTATYVVCCPNGFQLAAPEIETNSKRPGNGAYCYSALGVGELMDVTSFDSTGGSTYIAKTADSTTSNVVIADAFDGNMATPLTDFTDWRTEIDGATLISEGSGTVPTVSASVTGSTTSAASTHASSSTPSSLSSSGTATGLKTSSASRVSSVFSFIFWVF